MPEMMEFLGSTISKITKDNTRENMPHLEIIEVVLVHCNIVNNDYQPDLGIFIPNKWFCQLIDIFLINFIFLKTYAFLIKTLYL